MKKRITVVLYVETNDEIMISDGFILNDLRREINCASNFYDVESITIEDLTTAQLEKRAEERTETHACDLPQSTMGQVNDTAQSTNDCISRQAAIDELTEYGSGNDIYMSVGELKRRIEALPPAQPDHSADVSKMVNGDAVSRQAAIDEICLEWCNRKHDDCVHISDFNLGLYWCDGCSDVQTIMDLPLAQPEIIHCRECRNWINHCCYERKHIKTGFYTSGNKYCAWAERREG